jgi:hypothetical protein
MVQNFDHPAKVVTTYRSSDGLIHRTSFHVKPDPQALAQWDVIGNPLTEYSLVDATNSQGWNVQDAINQFWHGPGGLPGTDGFRTLFHSSTTFVSTALYKYDPQSNQPIWLAESDFDFAGTSILAFNPNSQHTWVGKSKEGGMFKLVFLDVGHPNMTQFVSRGSFNANENEMAQVVIGNTGLCFCRDGSAVASLRGYWGGQNEAVFKKRHRNL